LTACGSITTVSLPALPPDTLLQDCSATALPTGPLTNKDLAQNILDLRGDVASCNADKAALRGWKAQQNKDKQ